MTMWPAPSERGVVFHLLIFVSFFFFTAARADYAWIPKYDNLFVRLGGEFSTTSENYLLDGTRQDLVVNGQLSQLINYKFFIEPEFGFAQDWSAYLRLNYMQNSLDGVVYQQSAYDSASGLGDIYAGVKWNIVKKEPTITAEARFKIPTYSYVAQSYEQLVLGDGDFSVEGRIYAGYRLKSFFFSIAPGILGRSAGYSTAFTFLGAAGFTFSPAYLVATTEFSYSLFNTLFLDSSFSTHDAPGAGGSYALLSGSPSLFGIGLRAGMCFTKNYFLEAHVKQTLWGKRAPSFVDFTLNFFAKFDLFVPDPRKRIKEIPLDSPPDTFWDGE